MELGNWRSTCPHVKSRGCPNVIEFRFQVCTSAEAPVYLLVLTKQLLSTIES